MAGVVRWSVPGGVDCAALRCGGLTWDLRYDGRTTGGACACVAWSPGEVDRRRVHATGRADVEAGSRSGQRERAGNGESRERERATENRQEQSESESDAGWTEARARARGAGASPYQEGRTGRDRGRRRRWRGE